jgi:hypothetical protein
VDPLMAIKGGVGHQARKLGYSFPRLRIAPRKWTEPAFVNELDERKAKNLTLSRLPWLNEAFAVSVNSMNAGRQRPALGERIP